MTVIRVEPPEDYAQAALTMTGQVRELGKSVEGFAFAVKGRRAEIGSLASLPEEFLQHAAAALDIQPEFGAAYGVTAAEVRSALSFKREYGNTANEFRLVGKGIDDTIAERMAHIGEKCLNFYNGVKRATPRDSVENLTPHLKGMESSLGRGRKKKKSVPPTPPTPPVPPVPPVAPVPPVPVTKGDGK